MMTCFLWVQEQIHLGPYTYRHHVNGWAQMKECYRLKCLCLSLVILVHAPPDGSELDLILSRISTNIFGFCYVATIRYGLIHIHIPFSLIIEMGIYLVNFISLWPQTANYVVRAEDLPRAVPGRTIVYCLKTMARRTSSVRTLQSYQSGFGQLHFTLLNCISLSKNILQGNLWINSSFKECSLKICPAKINP